MRVNTKGIFPFLLAFALLWLMAAPLVRAQEAPQTTPDAPPAQEAPQTAPDAATRAGSAATRGTAAADRTTRAAAGTGDRKHQVFAVGHDFDHAALPNGDWSTPARLARRKGLGGYAPPFHLSALLVLANSDEGSILQLATSDNPLLGHDPYWLDTQMHSPSGSGMSLPDFLFYFFLPPSVSCMDQVSHNLANASRVSANDDSSPSALQVFYACPLGETLADFYASQVSAGITFRQGTTGDRTPPAHSANFTSRRWSRWIPAA